MGCTVSIVVVSYNTREMTLTCLQSVRAGVTGIEAEVIVLDNASDDGSADAIAQRFPEVRLIRSAVNLGFARGNNVAAREAQGRYLLLLNPDTVLKPDAIGNALAFAETHPEVAIVGGRTVFADGSLNPTSCHGFPTPWSVTCQGLGLSSLFRRSRLFSPEQLGGWRRDSVRRVDAVTGCFFLVRRAVWQELEGFDTAFFMYGEETDFCWRAAQRGYRAAITPDACLVHYGGASERARAAKMVRLFRAKAMLFRKHWPARWAVYGETMLCCWALSRMLAFACLRVFGARFAESYSQWREVWRRRGEYRNVTVRRADS